MALVEGTLHPMGMTTARKPARVKLCPTHLDLGLLVAQASSQSHASYIGLSLPALDVTSLPTSWQWWSLQKPLLPARHLLPLVAVAQKHGALAQLLSPRQGYCQGGSSAALKSFRFVCPGGRSLKNIWFSHVMI